MTDSDEVESFCKCILYKEIESVGIRLWDVFILIPNVFFLTFLCVLFKRARIKLYATNSPIFLCFYGLIWICAIFSVLRSVISMALSSTHIETQTQDIVNKVLWTAVRFVLLTTEISVLLLSLAFGQLESRQSIRAVLTTTGVIALLFSVVQGALELLLPSKLGVFGHGGVIFLLITSAIFTLLYLAVYLLPYTRVTNLIFIPVRPSFYRYAFLLFCNCLSLTIGCVLVLSPLADAQKGYCLINFAHLLYFTFFIPLVYLMFLNDYCYQPAKIPFSYTMNESLYADNVNSIDSINTYLENDNNSLVINAENAQAGSSCQAGVSGCAADGISNDVQRGPNNFLLNGPVYKGLRRGDDPINYHRFLYNTNIQSPGSLTGYSSVEESTTATASARGSMEFIQQLQPPPPGHPQGHEAVADET